MSYIGVSPAQSFTALLKQDFTTSATTSYTLDHAVNNANDIALFINFVRQEPTAAYSASGTSLTLTSATSGTDDMYCIYLGQALQTVNPSAGSVGLSQLSATGTKDSTTFLRGDNTFNTPPLGGITMADQWRLTATVTSDTDPISSNLEQIDTAGQGTLGSAMTVSSGVFTFPSTGIYFVDYQATCSANGSDNIIISIKLTTDNSTYTEVARGWYGVGQSQLGTAYCNTLVDVTDTSNVKVRFSVASLDPGSILDGDTTRTDTGFMFIRLGDT